MIVVVPWLGLVLGPWRFVCPGMRALAGAVTVRRRQVGVLVRIAEKKKGFIINMFYLRLEFSNFLLILLEKDYLASRKTAHEL